MNIISVSYTYIFQLVSPSNKNFVLTISALFAQANLPQYFGTVLTATQPCIPVAELHLNELVRLEKSPGKPKSKLKPMAMHICVLLATKQASYDFLPAATVQDDLDAANGVSEETLLQMARAKSS